METCLNLLYCWIYPLEYGLLAQLLLCFFPTENENTVKLILVISFLNNILEKQLDVARLLKNILIQPDFQQKIQYVMETAIFSQLELSSFALEKRSFLIETCFLCVFFGSCHQRELNPGLSGPQADAPTTEQNQPG
uniref:Uncharacterized protein n=1 Tax=Molossus molossus TaxID=27622 RepID=A0A7J8FS08_MOLMO|nr:hypothetical protein HJG59_008405 [Molossus molossus]